jgi:hypothetical protein
MGYYSGHTEIHVYQPICSVYDARCKSFAPMLVSNEERAAAGARAVRSLHCLKGQAVACTAFICAAEDIVARILSGISGGIKSEGFRLGKPNNYGSEWKKLELSTKRPECTLNSGKKPGAHPRTSLPLTLAEA